MGDNLKSISFSLGYFIVKRQYAMPITYKMGVNQMFMSSVRLLVRNMLLAVKFWGSQKLNMDFQLKGVGTTTPTPGLVLFKGQVYMHFKGRNVIREGTLPHVPSQQAVGHWRFCCQPPPAAFFLSCVTVLQSGWMLELWSAQNWVFDLD